MTSYHNDLDLLKNRAPHFIPMFFFDHKHDITGYHPDFEFAKIKAQDLMFYIPKVLSNDLKNGPQEFVDRLAKAPICRIKSRM